MLHNTDNYPHSSTDNRPLSQSDARIYCRDMAMTFRDALNKRLEESGSSLRSACKPAGVSYDQMLKVSQGKSKSTNVDDAVKIANHFGLSLDEFIGDR